MSRTCQHALEIRWLGSLFGRRVSLATLLGSLFFYQMDFF